MKIFHVVYVEYKRSISYMLEIFIYFIYVGVGYWFFYVIFGTLLSLLGCSSSPH